MDLILTAPENLLLSPSRPKFTLSSSWHVSQEEPKFYKSLPGEEEVYRFRDD